MKKLIQTRLHNPPEQYGNCFPTVIACFMDLDNPEDVLQFQEFYDFKETGRNWVDELNEWLLERGWEWFSIQGHHQVKKDEFYLVTGNTKRSKTVTHVCIYQNGKLYHDPHPDQSGLTSEIYFEILKTIDPMTEEQNMVRALENMQNNNNKSCQNCQWGMYEKGQDFITCGHHIDNFRIDSFCTYWTDPKDPDYLKWRQKQKEKVREKIKTT